MSVKNIFPSISISKKKPKTSSAGSPQPQSLPFLRPLTPESRRKQGSGLSSPNEPLKAFPPSSSPITVSPLSLTQTSSETNLASLENGVQLSQSTPDLRYGLRQVRSASQPSRPTNLLRDRESFSSVTLSPDRSHSVHSENSYFTEAIDVPMIEQEDIIALTHHVRTFSEALSSLRNTFIECEENPDGDPPEVKAHERLGEVLSVLKGVLNKYQPLHSTDILASAGTLINKVKSHNYEDSTKVPDEFYESIDQLALAFSSSVSDFLMGEQDMVLTESSMNREHSRSLEAFNDEDVDDNMGMMDVDEQGYEEESEDDHDYSDDKDERRYVEKKESDTSAEKANELDRALIQLEHGVDIALQRTKIWAKYSKDIATYVDRRAHLELEYTNKLTKLAQATKSAVKEESYLPFQSIFVTALDQDIEYAENSNKTYTALLQTRFMEPLTGRRNKHDRTRKELKDTWTKACKKLNEALANLKKAKALYVQKQQELEKSKPSEVGGKEDSSSSAPLSAFARGTKRKEGDLRKADEAEELYKQCVAEANARQKELERTKAHVLVELRQLIYQCDMTMKAVTCNYFQMMSKLASTAPIQFQTLADSSRMYEPGNQFADFVRLQQANSPPAVDRVYCFEPYTLGGCPEKSQQTPSRHNSLFEARTQSSAMEENARMSPFNARRNRSVQLNSSQIFNSSHPPLKAWSQKENNSDADSTTSRSLPGSPNHSPSESRRNSRMPRARSLELVSSDDGAKENDDRVGLGIRNETGSPGSKRKPPAKPSSSAGPFQNCRLSVAAQTHTLKKLRSASKCRSCDSYVYFNGAECEVCGLTCHKKCLARLKIKCGTHQRSGRRMTTFGVDINQHIQDTSTKEENVPFIISSCINEIDQRGLDVKGIYRVSGVKSKVEKLCQSFESGEQHADLSDIPPHVIAAVLKLYIRQLPAPLLTFELYPDFIRIAKESFSFINNVTPCKQASEDGDVRGEYDKLLGKLREVVMRLPKTNRMTTARIIKHLKKVSEHEEANAMPGSNLAIVFGPTLLRPNDTTSTLSSLVDMPHQSRLVELLITNPEVFKHPDDDEEPEEPLTPVEKFTPPKPREREGSLFAVQSLRSNGNNPDESYEAEDEASLNTPDKNTTLSITDHSPDVRKSSLPTSVTSTGSPNNAPLSPSPSTRSSLGFGSEFFELLAKSNNRAEVQPDQTIPEFLLPDLPRERPTPIGEDSDLEDEDEDDTTQGTSGSRTPDDELETSHFSHRESATRSSSENLVEGDKLGSPVESSPFYRELSIISRSSSSYSFAPSFSSDFPDTDSLLPDLSDSVGTGKFDALRGVEVSDAASESRDMSDFRIRSFSSDTEKPPRPRNLGLIKRNSDLPGRVQRGDEFSTGFFPVGIKPSVSDTNLNQDPYRIEEELQFRTISEMASSASALDSFEDDKASSEEKNYFGSHLRLDECAITIDIDKEGICPLGGDVSKEMEVSPVHSSAQKNADSPVSPVKEPPPVPPKPSVKSPSVETKEFDIPDECGSDEESSVSQETASRELIIPVMTALQERRPSTPNCSTAQTQAATDVQDRPGTACGSSDVKRKKSSEVTEAKPKSRTTYTRVSVKDRLQQYEKGRSESFDSSRKAPELSSAHTVASRKEIFETKEKGGERGLYKRISDIGGRKPRCDSSSGSGSASGSPKSQRNRLQEVEDSVTEKDKGSNPHVGLGKSKSIEQLYSEEKRPRHRRERSDNADRPRSLILDRIRVDKIDTPTSDSLRLEGEKGTLSPREIDIPLEFEDGMRPDRLRKSPNTSPRSSRLNIRSPFPDDDNGEEREPQFV